MSDTIAKLLQDAVATLNTDSARLDAELLLCHSIGRPREYLYAWSEHIPTDLQQQTFNQLLARRIKGEPIAHLTGIKEFWSHQFTVTKDTLIPRPETELLVELSLQKLKQCPGSFLDLGTGSGAIAICVALEMPSIDVDATDISAQALKVAAMNADILNARVNFKQSDWFEKVNTKTYAVIATNPPYIPDGDPHLKQSGLPFEPQSALRSCDNGLADITAIISQSSKYLDPTGWLLIEHGHTQGPRTRELMQSHHFQSVETFKDLGLRERVTVGQSM